MTHRFAKSLIHALTFCVMICAGCSQLPTQYDFSSVLDTPIGNQKDKGSRKDKASQKDQGSETDSRQTQLWEDAKQAEEHGEFQIAISRYSKLVEKFPNHAQGLHRLAVLQDQYGDPGESANLYLRAIHYSPNDPDLLCDYGYSRYVNGDLPLAEATLRRCLKLDEDHPRALINLGLVLTRQGNDQQALEAFQQAGLSRAEAQQNLHEARKNLELTDEG